MSLTFIVYLFVSLTFSLLTAAMLAWLSWSMWQRIRGKPTVYRVGGAALILLNAELIILIVAVMIPWLCHMALMLAEYFAPVALG